jgi:diguanylate cyclase (GGDEF)-like protein
VPLHRQLTLVVAVLFLLMFAGTLLVNFQSTRAFLMDQLESHAQDTATSLGLSLSQHMHEADLPLIHSMVDAIFDRGYYRSIQLEAIGGELLAARELQPAPETVPAWFVDWVALQTPRATSAVMAGWHQAGTVSVHSHPGYAYNELWRLMRSMLIWFGGMAVAVAIVGVVALRVLLRPLAKVERQAEGICARHYQTQDKLPRTRELRNVVLAMNRMTTKVKDMFAEQSQTVERLRQQVYRDPLTGLGNRRYFQAQLQTLIGSDVDGGGGALFLVQVRDLEGINKRRGFEAGDELVTQAGRLLEAIAAETDKAIAARLTGGDFALLAAAMSGPAVERLAARISDDLARLYAEGVAETGHVGNVGAVSFLPGLQSAELLAEADLALRTAQAAGPNAWHHHQRVGTAELPDLGSKREWKLRIEDVVRTRGLVLHVQPAVDAVNPTRILHQEVLMRIPGEEGRLWSAGMFMPIAEHLQLARDLDRVMLEQLLARPVREDDPAFAVNLSPASLLDPDFLGWLLDSLKRPGRRARIIFEFPEFGAVRELELLRDFVTRVRGHGHGFALDHFGRGFSAFGYLQSLRPDYVKIDGSYTGQVVQSSDAQFFVTSLCSIAHSLDINTIAQAVENEAQWEMLQSLHIDGIQGYAVSPPRPIDERRDEAVL